MDVYFIVFEMVAKGYTQNSFALRIVILLGTIIIRTE